MNDFDFSILNSIQEKFRGNVMDKAVPFITKFGDKGIFWLTCGTVLIFTKKYRKCGVAMISAISGGFVIGNLIIKNAVKRSRPCWISPLSDMLIAVPSDYSFPSGHSTASFAGAVVLFRYNRKLGIPALALASLVAFSRMYLYAHFPTDVVAGSLLGIAMGTMAVKATEKYTEKRKLRRENK